MNKKIKNKKIISIGAILGAATIALTTSLSVTQSVANNNLFNKNSNQIANKSFRSNDLFSKDGLTIDFGSFRDLQGLSKNDYYKRSVRTIQYNHSEEYRVENGINGTPDKVRWPFNKEYYADVLKDASSSVSWNWQKDFEHKQFKNNSLTEKFYVPTAFYADQILTSAKCWLDLNWYDARGNHNHPEWAKMDTDRYANRFVSEDIDETFDAEGWNVKYLINGYASLNSNEGLNQSDDGYISTKLSVSYDGHWTPNGDYIFEWIPDWVSYRDDAREYRHKVYFNDTLNLKSDIAIPNLENIANYIGKLIKSFNISTNSEYQDKTIESKKNIIENALNSIFKNSDLVDKLLSLKIELPTDFKIDVKFDESKNLFVAEFNFFNNRYSFVLENANLVKNSNRLTTFKFDTIKAGSAEFKKLYYGVNPDKNHPEPYDYKADWINYGVGNFESGIGNSKAWDNINANIDYFYENPLENTHVILNNSWIDSEEDWKINMKNQFLGNNYGSSATLEKWVKIEFLPTPGINNSTGKDQTGIFNGLEKYINDWIVSESKMPSIDELRNMVATFMSQKSKIDLMPLSMRPQSNKFDKNSVVMSPSNLKKNGSEITVSGVILKTPGRYVNEIAFPDFKFKLQDTTLIKNNIPASDPLTNFSASQLSNSYNSSELSNDIESMLTKWIADNARFDGYTESQKADESKIEINSVTARNNNVNVNFKVTDAYDNGNNENGKSFELTISKFPSSDSKKTKLLISSFDWNTPEFKKVFRDTNGSMSPFFVDWNNVANYISKAKTSLLKEIKNNINKYFSNTSLGFKLNDVISHELDDSKNKVVFTISYDGMGENGFERNLTSEITINLRPAPKATDSIFNGLEQKLQNAVKENQGLLPSSEKLASVVADFLNNNVDKTDLPLSSIPSSGRFTASDVNVVIPSLTDKEVTFAQGSISTKETCKLEMPEIVLNCKKTSIKKKAIAASGEIANLSPSEIVGIVSSNNYNHPKVQKIKNWLNTEAVKKSIFNDLNNTSEVTQISGISFGSDQNSLNVSFKLTNTYEINKVEETGATFNVEINNFNSSADSQTIFNDLNLSWNTPEFKELMGSISTYTFDWKNNYLETVKDRIVQGINQNKDKYFTNLSSLTEVKSTTLTVDEANNSATATITYSGIDESGVLSNELKGTINFNLRSFPGTGPDASNPAINPLLGFEDYLQNWVDSQNRIPNNYEIKDIAAKFLNSIKHELPISIIPSSGDFKSQQINDVNEQNIIKEGNSVTYKKGSITTKTTPTLSFDESTVSLENTTSLKADTIAADGELAKLNAGQLINDNKYLSLLNNWIISKDIFNNFRPTTQNTNIIKVEAGEHANSIKVTLLLKNAITINGAADLQVELTIIGLNSNSTSTTLSIDQIDARTSLFAKVFGKNKGFYVDWKKYNDENLSTLSSQLKEYINSNKDMLFKNKIDSTSVSKVEISDSKENEFIAKVTYSGLNENNEVSENIVTNITIKLKSTPSNNLNSELWNGLQDAFDNWILSENKIPEDEEVKQIIVDYLNSRKDFIPNVSIPGGENGSFNNSNIQINDGAIERYEDAITIYENKIITTGDNIQALYVPSIDATLNELTEQESGITNDLLWIIIGSVGGVLLILIILLVVYISKRKKGNSNDLDLAF